MLLDAGAKVSNLGDVRWLATEDGEPGQGTGRHIACCGLEASDDRLRRDWILDDLEAHDEFVCSRCLKEKPRAGSVTMPGEDTHTSYSGAITCLADAYRQRYGDVGLAPYAAEGR